jgi:hypothetical protein
MRSPKKALCGFVVLTGLALVACGNAAPAGDPAKAIEAYLLARVKPDADEMIRLSCAAWEPQARLEFTSIQGRSPQLDGMSCSQTSVDGSTAVVACQGMIRTTYDGEQREFDLAERAFTAVQEGGEWRMCGYR